MSLSIFGALGNAARNLGNLKATLVHAREALEAQKVQFPDLAPQLDAQIADIDTRIAEMDAPLSPAALVALTAVIINELNDVRQGHFTPTPHAGDSI